MGCCCICSSWRGAAYFATSLQIFFGLYYYFEFGLLTLIKGDYGEYFEDDRKKILFPLFLLYLTILTLLGFLNFIAVQRESGGLLKWITRALLVLQVLQLTTTLLLAYVFPDENEDVELYKIFHLKCFILSLILSILYFLILYFYSRQMNGANDKEKNFEIEDRYYDPPKKIEQQQQEQGDIVKHLRPTAPPPTPSPKKLIDDVDGIQVDKSS